VAERQASVIENREGHRRAREMERQGAENGVCAGVRRDYIGAVCPDNSQ
jgi:hypothetical protein